MTAKKYKAQALLLICMIATGCGVKENGVGDTASPVSTATPSTTISGPSSTTLGSSAQFTSSAVGSPTSLCWMVNGVPGGNDTVGTISDTGLYIAPQTMLQGGNTTISIRGLSDSSITASTTVPMLNPVASVKSVTLTPTGPPLQYLLQISGAGFVSSSSLTVNGSSIPSVTGSWTNIIAQIVVANSATSINLAVSNPDPGANSSGSVLVSIPTQSITISAAARLLDQSSFGPTMTAIQHVQKIGLDAYLQEQFNTPTSLLAPLPETGVPCVEPNVTPIACAGGEWWQVAVSGPDQLRQRVAFALSEMFVISVGSGIVPPYHNMLANDAFGNFATLLKDVTTSPGMGVYLNLLNSPIAPSGEEANENYAREVMQLFTIGPYELNPDGSQQLNAMGTPIPAYTEEQVEAFARAFTGWTYPLSNGEVPNALNWAPVVTAPLVPVEEFHDTTEKKLLNGEMLPAGQTAESDMDAALANLFNHPNVGPFVCKQLIQHLVTSTPSPAYIARAAAVFAADGSGVRGNMQAVIQAILEDPEAREGDINPGFDGGRLREPVMYLAALLRGLNFTNVESNGLWQYLSTFTGGLGEEPYQAPSVFNFFPTDYIVPGTTLNAPEFGLENNANYMTRLTLADQVTGNQLRVMSVDLSDSSSLGTISADPGSLADYLSALFLHGQMSPAMRTELVGTLTPISSLAQRVRVGIYLVVTSPSYLIIH